MASIGMLKNGIRGWTFPHRLLLTLPNLFSHFDTPKPSFERQENHEKELEEMARKEVAAVSVIVTSHRHEIS